MRAQEGDTQKAIACFQKSISLEGCPPVVHRSLGLLFWKTGKLEEAKVSFKNYLEVEPNAPDYQMIKSYLKELE